MARRHDHAATGPIQPRQRLVLAAVRRATQLPARPLRPAAQAHGQDSPHRRGDVTRRTARGAVRRGKAAARAGTPTVRIERGVVWR
jgi:hypothetical protein